MLFEIHNMCKHLASNQICLLFSYLLVEHECFFLSFYYENRADIVWRKLQDRTTPTKQNHTYLLMSMSPNLVNVLFVYLLLCPHHHHTTVHKVHNQNIMWKRPLSTKTPNLEAPIKYICVFFLKLDCFYSLCNFKVI